MNGHRGTAAAGYRSLAYVALTLAAGWSLASPAIRQIRLWDGSTRDADDICQLDCFDKPAVAAAVLRTEGERLVNAFIQARDFEAETHLGAHVGRDVDLVSVPQRGEGAATPLSASGPPSPAQLADIQSLERLRAQVQAVRSDLDNKLLLAYSDSGLWAEFVQHYLGCLRELPEDPVLIWSQYALEHSAPLGRTAEVVESLQQLSRSKQGSRTDLRLRSALAEWRSRNASGRDIRHP